MLALERRNRILEQLQEEKRVVVSELSQSFGVSEETIRRDLEKLEKEGIAKKSYGGALLNESASIDMPFNVRKKVNIAGKQMIAEQIAQRVQDGDHIILDASSTAVFIAKALKEKSNLTVITNSVEVIVELSDVSDWNIICTGGSLREGYLALIGPKTEENLQDFYADKLILSCKGVDMERGITDGSELFSKTKKVMTEVSGEVILAADHTKFGKVAFSRLCSLDAVDILVTDKKPSKEWMAHLEKKQVQCVYPDK